MEQIGFFKNKGVLKSVLECLIFCGKSNIDPYRDPDKDLYGYDSDSEEGGCEQNGEDNSNLQALLSLRMSLGDQDLLQQFKGKCKSQQYIPKSLQVDLFKLLGEVATEKVAKEVNISGFYGILACDIRDFSSPCDFCPISVRFVNENNKIVEKLLTFVHSDSNCNVEQAIDICHAITRAGLDLTKCRALNFDGTSISLNLSATRVIIQQYPLALHLHNYENVLDTTLAYMICIPRVHYSGTVSLVSRLFHESDHCKDVFESQLKEFLPNVNCTELANDFRSLLKSEDCFKKVIDGYEALLNALVILRDDMSYRHNYRSSSMPPSMLLDSVDSFETVFHSILYHNLFRNLSNVTSRLRGSAIDVVDGYCNVAQAVQDLRTVRTTIDEFHSMCYEEAKRVALKLDIPEEITTHWFKKEKAPESCSCYFKVKSTIPLLEALIDELDVRFSPACCNSVKGLAVIPSVMNKIMVDGKHDWKAMFMDFCVQYKEDLPRYECLSLEIDAWKEKWSQEGGKVPSTIL